jgi:hypothetical protein
LAVSTSAAGAVAFMQVVNNGKGCGVNLISCGTPVTSVTVVGQPAHGSVVVKASRLGYTRAPDFLGQDEFRVATEPLTKVKVLVTVRQAAKAP